MAESLPPLAVHRRLARRPGGAIVVAAALLIASLLLALHNEDVARRQHIQQLTVQADILAGSVAAALAFDDRIAAQEYIDALHANPEIDAAGAYGLDGQLVAGFAVPDHQLPRINRLQPPHMAGGEAVITAPVVQNGTRLGSVYLRASTEPWTRRVSRYVGIGIILIMAALLVAALGSSYAAATEANRRLKEEMEARQDAEAALRQSQKMEAMGQLTGGVAHDFNNLLMAASSGLELLDRTRDPDRRERLKQGIRQAIDRGAKLTQQLLTFARRSPVHPEVIDLGARIAELRTLLDHSLREDVAVEIDMPADLWPVEVDVSQLEVAVLNVAVNARDAMPNGGTICIAARNVPAENGEGDVVHLSVRDEGTGMPLELIDKVFEPFFTTKGVGHGTGLGLSQVYGFARAAGGTVRIDSEEGRGTTVTIMLPRSFGELPQAVPQDDETGDAPPQCRILLAEDDPSVGDLVEQMLEELGYAVTRAGDAQVALAKIDGGLVPDALLSDMVMPGEMGGLDLARAARQLRPELPVLLMTGYSAAASAAAEDAIELLTKPFSLEDLRKHLAKLLRDAGECEPGVHSPQ
jgi:signal transduction histidine kinase/CheY-like chemotaxis protein